MSHLRYLKWNSKRSQNSPNSLSQKIRKILKFTFQSKIFIYSIGCIYIYSYDFLLKSIKENYFCSLVPISAALLTLFLFFMDRKNLEIKKLAFPTIIFISNSITYILFFNFESVVCGITTVWSNLLAAPSADNSQ